MMQKLPQLCRKSFTPPLAFKFSQKMQFESVRAATPDDAAQLVVLVNEAYRPQGATVGWTHENKLVAGPRISLSQMQALLAQTNATVLLGMADVGIRACVLLEREIDQVMISMLAVEPTLQGRGAGKALLAEAEQYAVYHFKPTRLRMHALAARPELVAFYQRRGYADTGERLPYPHTAGVGIPRRVDLQLMLLEKVCH